MISIRFYVNACITSSALAQSLYEKSSHFVFQLRQGSRLRLFRRPLRRPPCRLVCSVVFSVVRSVVHSVVRSVVRSVVHPIGALLWYRELLNVRPKERCILFLCANYLKSNKARKCVISADINAGIHPLHHNGSQNTVQFWN